MGERLDRFELMGDVASGGMATVYLARVRGGGPASPLYAIKRLHPHLAKDKDFVEMFLDEARLAARIQHPNVVAIHEIGTNPVAGRYLVMDFVEGDTQARLYAKAAAQGIKIPPGVGLRILLDALNGLHAAHELRDDEGNPLEIVHRDVSPQNVLVGVDGVARITDFGVARAASRLSTTRTGQLKGKLAYMAPEQARSKQAVDRRADVFAMGILLWEALSGRRLFRGETDAETLNRLLYEEIPALRSVAPTIPAQLEAIVMKALSRDPASRFATAAELAGAVEGASRALGIVATPHDVASTVERVLGPELAQHRETVREFLAREDSDAPYTAPPESITKVEPVGEREPIPPPGSSVSSVMHLPLPPSALASPSQPPAVEGATPSARKKRAGLTLGVAAASLAVVFGFVAWRAPHAGPASATGATSAVVAAAAAAAAAAPPAAPAPAPAADPTPPEAAAAAVLPGSPIITVTSTKDAGRDGAALAGEPSLSGRPERTDPRASRHHRPQASSPSPVQAVEPEKAADAPAPLPDDITRNPYR